jgi:preprotein translocase subunit SecA
MGRNFDNRQTADYFSRPERGDVRRTALDRLAWNLSGYIIGPSRVQASGLAGIPAAVEKYEHGLKEKGDGALREIAGSLRYKLRRQGFDKDTVAEAFALIREAAGRVLGMRHFDCQFIAGYALLKGFLAEMDTGEGKTLVATLPAATAALAGVPVHVITVNDYLTSRDAENMGELYRFLGLSVGCIVHEKTAGQRRAAYGCDITYWSLII